MSPTTPEVIEPCLSTERLGWNRLIEALSVPVRFVAGNPTGCMSAETVFTIGSGSVASTVKV